MYVVDLLGDEGNDLPDDGVKQSFHVCSKTVRYRVLVHVTTQAFGEWDSLRQDDGSLVLIVVVW